MTRRRAWEKWEISCFLSRTDTMTAEEIATQIGRSVPAVQAMRRKLKRLRELGVKGFLKLRDLLYVNDGYVHSHTLAEIRARAKEPRVPVREHLRRGKVYGRPHLVEAHERRGRK